MATDENGHAVDRGETVAPDELLTTTRSVRRRLDLRRPVPREVIERCLEIAVQAPSGGNANRYHFVVVDDPRLRSEVARIYRTAYDDAIRNANDRSGFAVSSNYLADHLHEVPVQVVFCLEVRPVESTAFTAATRYGSILPAAWSFMLALRARGIASCWTTTHLLRAEETARVLGIPDSVLQAALIPVAYFAGDAFRPGRRVPARARTYWNGWSASCYRGS